MQKENEELKKQLEFSRTHKTVLDAERNKYYKVLEEIREVAQGMHDMWINQTRYTDVYDLAEHLLKCELNRIIYKLDEVLND